MLDGANIIFGGNSYRSDFFALEISFNVGVDSAESVHFGQFFSLYETDLELLELFLNLSRHEHDLVCIVGARLVIKLHLLVARTLHSDTDLEVTSDI